MQLISTTNGVTMQFSVKNSVRTSSYILGYLPELTNTNIWIIGSQKRTVEKNQAKEKKGNSSLSNSDASNEKLREIHAKINEEPLPPPNSDERRQMFIASVSEAEQLLAEGLSNLLSNFTCA